jgi:endonuclease YncB( thermonuclease family)
MRRHAGRTEQRALPIRLVPGLALLAAAALLVGCEGGASGASDTASASETGIAPAEEVPSGEGRRRTFVVAKVIDGDTIELRQRGVRVRLVQIDAPETGGECYSRKARAVLRKLVPEGSRVRLQVDRKLDRKDRYGRLLRYVLSEGTNVNLELVKRGAASVWFFEGERGRYAKRLLRAAEQAKAEARGLWQACRGTVLDPLHAIKATSERPKGFQTNPLTF